MIPKRIALLFRPESTPRKFPPPSLQISWKVVLHVAWISRVYSLDGVTNDISPVWAGRLPEWGVTILQADEEMDAGDVWKSSTFSVPHSSTLTKSALYNKVRVAVNSLLCTTWNAKRAFVICDQYSNGKYTSDSE